MVRHTRVSDVINALIQPERSKRRNPALAKRRRNRVAAIETLQTRQLLAVVTGVSTREPIATSPVAAQEASVAAIAATTAQTETTPIAGLHALSVDAAFTESTTDEHLHLETEMDITQRRCVEAFSSCEQEYLAPTTHTPWLASIHSQPALEQ